MREFYWVCLIHRREVYPMAYHAAREKADATAARLNAGVADMGGNVHYDVRSDGGNARRFLDGCNSFRG